MAQSIFPEGVSEDIPDPVAVAVKDIMDAVFKPVDDFIAGMKKVNDYAAAGRNVDCEH